MFKKKLVWGIVLAFSLCVATIGISQVTARGRE